MKAFYTSIRALAMVALVWSGNIMANQYFVSPTGNDSNSGTIDQPFASILKAHNVVSAGDTIYVREGTYSLSTTTVLSKNGAEPSKYYLLAYPGERALLDFSSMDFNSSNRGIRVSGNYWHVRGLDIKGAGDNGMHISGSNNIIEYCSFFENRDSGLQIGNGASNNRIINCDSYFNADPGFENADGFAAKLDVGSGNYFYGCRAWQNADDGFDGYLRGADNVETTLENCWVFKNGFDSNGSPTLPNGDGNGFKMGGGDNGNSDSLKHNITLKNCLAFDNRVRGFDQNNNRGSMTLINTTSFRNSTNYSISGAIAFGRTASITNGVSHNAPISLANHVVQQTNSWMLGSAVVDGDFASVDTAGVRGPRKPDGSLPDVQFMKLKEGSKLVDVGTDAGLPFAGPAPDLGAFEYGLVVAVAHAATTPSEFSVSPNYPNPFNPETNIRFAIPRAGVVTIQIYNILGQLTTEFVQRDYAAGEHTVRWDATDRGGSQVPSGTYIAVIRHETHVKSLKLVLIR